MTQGAAVRLDRGSGLLIVALVGIGICLRPAVTSVGPLLDDIRASLGISAAWAGTLTALPGLCFAAAGLIAPALARRAGVGRTISIALVILTAGLLARVCDGLGALIGGTLIASAGIAVINVLVAAVIAESFSTRMGFVTGMYTAALHGGGAVGTAATAPVERILGSWRSALAFWAAVVLVALAIWLKVQRRKAFESPSPSPRAGRSLLRNRLAWVVTLFFGCQAFLAYVVMGWLPTIFIDHGMPKSTAGLLVGLVWLVDMPVSIGVATLAARSPSQTWWIVGLGSFGLAGTCGLLLAPTKVPVLWAIFIGLGLSVFSLTLTVIELRARAPRDVVQLSGMAQGFGYLLAGAGPFLFGLLHDLTRDWSAPLIMVAGVYLALMTFGGLAGRNQHV